MSMKINNVAYRHQHQWRNGINQLISNGVAAA
jgi:hypothetical protein